MTPMAVRLSPAFRRAAILGALALLPACAAAHSEKNPVQHQPAEIAQEISMGRSGFGNYLAARHAQGQFAAGEAASFYLHALESDPENPELLSRAFVLMAIEGDMEQAEELARRLLTFEDTNSLARLLLASRAAKAGDWSMAERHVEFLPKRGLGSFMTPLISAWARVGAGDYDKALTALQPLSETSSFAAIHDFHAALISDLADQPKVAEDYYRNTVAGTAGLTLRSIRAVGSFYQRTGQMDKAQALYTRYQSHNPEAVLFDSARMLAQGSSVERPVADARQGMAEAFFGAATTMRQSNAPDMALLFARMALDLEPNLPLAYLLVGDLLQGLNRLEEANAAYLAIDPSEELWWTTQLRVAGNLNEMGRSDEAIALLRDLAAKDPMRHDALVSLGEVLRGTRKFPEAIDAYSEALTRLERIERHHWPLLYSRGIAYEQSDRWPEAERDFLQALELEPDQPYVLNYLGYSWVERGVHLDQAKRMIQKAVELRPNDGYIVDSLGWVLYKTGDYPGAVQYLERAVELRPADPVINDHFGDALWKVGRTEEARFQWRRALSHNPEPDLQAKIEQKLKQGLP
ncbi:tetratricopeptide repeat protein [Telmatospirillum sp. J64-1]|uniref:tetratricopeptide repeat protein n=1 Tax=Telmatospirillum sp. J64-1 TaxID=2502183 RepID=UPI00115C9A7E|nr:tetratricopeptide repeat protein [Telmatospirillum sp. J64-1]